MIDETRNGKPVVGNFPQKKDNGVQDVINKAKEKLYARQCEGSEMTGWINWPREYRKSEEYREVKKVAKEIRENNDTVVVIGIGGSYLTPQMVIHSECGEFYNEWGWANGTPNIYFAGCDLSPDRLKKIIDVVEGYHWSIIYISKSGGTMEPALTFRVLWDILYKQYGEEANERVYAITDAEKGVLRNLADTHGWKTFIIPNGIGGRFSGLTACGLLPIAIAGIDTDKLLDGAIYAMDDCIDNPENFAAKYAEWRFGNLAGYVDGKCYSVEFLATNTPYLTFLTEWLKQLFGESEGKSNKGIFPASGVFPTDLHSLGQFLQEGKRDLIFETFIKRGFNSDVIIPESNLDDNLDKYAGKKFTQAASAAMEGAFKAHSAGGNPCAMIEIDNSTEGMGAFMYYSFITTALTAIAMEVNPFNQPGVELHKKMMKESSEWDN